MDIIVLDQLLKQTKKRQMAPSVVSKVYQEIELLEKLRKHGQNSLADYLKNQNGKKMQGSENIYKYRLTDGDRILYTYGKYLNYIRKDDHDSLVIVAYAKHDVQGDIKLPCKQKYYYGEEIISTFSDIGITTQDLIDMSIDDLESIEEILSDKFARLHSLYVFNGQDYQNDDPDAYDVYLSDEQSQYIDEYIKYPRPLLIQGGAGTGKTVMATHILANYKVKNESLKCAYFTQSRELLKKIEKQYRYLSKKDRNKVGLEGADEDTSFFNINDYCRDKLDLAERNLVKTDQFLEFANSSEIAKELKNHHIEPLDMWAEIRGTIKGGLDENWRRTTPLNRKNYKREIIDELDSLGLLIWQKNKQLFVLSETNLEEIVLSSDAVEIYQEIKNYFDSVDSNLSMIDEESYIKLSPELSTLSPKYRDIAYRISQKYQKWLGDEKYDENDLIRRFLSQIEETEKYDMVVVDEIQDYTELQIYMMHRLVKDCRFLVMAGDAHQNINPTVFSDRRLYALVGKNLLTQSLSKNFRCQKRIIECANGLSELRKEYLAKGKGDRYEVSEREGELPIMLEYNSDNERELLAALMDYPSTAVLVPTEKEKERLRKIAKEISDIAPDIVFTVAEIKGMEYRYVVCYNLVGCFDEVWKQILEGKKAKQQTKYQYYFNLFYVGITRTQDYLCIMEPRKNDLFYDLLEQKANLKIKEVGKFDHESLLISRLTNSSEDWMKQAKQYEEAGKYDQALQRYRKADAPETIVKNCEMKYLADKREYEQALILAMELNDKDSAKKWIREIDSEGDLARLVSVWLDPSMFSKSNGFVEGELSDLISRTIDNDQKDIIERVFTKWLGENFEVVVKNLVEKL